MRRPIPILAALALPLLLTACGLAGALDDDAVVPKGGSGSAAGMSEGEESWAFEILALVNAERAAAGLEPVEWCQAAADAAYAHSFDMDVRAYFGHESPDGETPGDRLHEQGVEWLACGENIAKGFGSPAEVMAAWMASEGHAANILGAGYTDLGVGIHTASHDGPWWTQAFHR